MLTVDLDPELEQQLSRLAQETGQTQDFYAGQAIRQFLEDRDDYLEGIASLHRNEKRISFDQLERELDLAPKQDLRSMMQFSFLETWDHRLPRRRARTNDVTQK